MEEYVLKAKHYQIFLSLVTPALFVSFVPNFDASIPLIKIVVGTLPYVVWVFVLGRALNHCLPVRRRLRETFLMVNLSFFCFAFAFIAMFLDYTVRFYGWGVLIPLYMVFSFLYLFYFASKAMTSVEKEKRTSFGDHFVEMLLLLGGYLTIWYIQPRLNEIWEIHKGKFEEDESGE